MMEAFRFILLLILPSCLLAAVRFDGRCGPENPDFRGEPAECDADSENSYCCSLYGYCGYSEEHCACEGCTDYREKKYGVRSDGRCGPDYLASNGEPGKCSPDWSAFCCSQYGYCGNSPEHCGCDNCVDYREIAYQIRHDARCGPDYPLKNGQASKCHPDSFAHCCSSYGFCGNSEEHCFCNRCVDYREMKYGVRADGKCGESFPLANGESSQCLVKSTTHCCSNHGWCGNSEEYCDCNGCTDYRLLAISARYDGRCGTLYPDHLGRPAKCDAESTAPCCSSSGWCGSSEHHCSCERCVDYRLV